MRTSLLHGAFIVVALGCSEPSSPGAVKITVATSGEDLDLDGYQFELDGRRLTPAAVQGYVRIPEVSEGRHVVVLIGVAGNCDVTAGAHREVDVVSEAEVAVDFPVHCVGTGVEVQAIGTGMDLDHEYRLTIDGADRALLEATRSHRLTRLPSGPHEIRLTDIAPNCVVTDPNPRIVTVAARMVEPVSFTVTCERRWTFAFVRGDSVTLASVDGSMTNSVALGDAPAWSPEGSRLAFACDGDICVLDLAVGEIVRIGNNALSQGPAWRRDGARITYASFSSTCDFYCTFHGLAEVALDGTGRSLTALPDSVLRAWDLDWSPAADLVAFSCTVGSAARMRTRVCRIGPGGSGFRVLGPVGSDDGGGSWRPDGGRIALHAALVNGAPEIVTTDLDGGQLTRVIPGILGSDPDWSPNGSKLVFSSGRGGLYLVGADGTGLIRLTAGPDFNPAWRP